MSEQQWSWLESVFSETNDDAYLLISGVQAIPSNRLLNAEHWPRPELQRLIDLLHKHQVPGFMIISGDVHHAQVLSSQCNLLGYPLIEVTTSGLTHTCNKNALGKCKLVMDTITPKHWAVTEPFIELNYLTVKVDNGTLDIAIRGQEILHEFTVDLKDMQYKPTEHNFCEYLLTSQ